MAAVALVWSAAGPTGSTGSTRETTARSSRWRWASRSSLELEGNPTTGYSWQVTAIDPAVLAPAGEPDYESSSDADGAGGIYTFRFDAVGPGETEVVLQYFPSWEEPTDTAGRFTFTSRVG